MFDGLKNMAALPGLMGKMKEMQGKMQSMQEDLARRQVTADAGGGMVEATVNGRLEVTAIKIDHSRLGDPADIEMLEDVIVAAIRAAQAKAAQEMQTAMHKLAGNMGLPPGMIP